MTPDPAALRRLAERAEAATGPDRELDAMIHHAIKRGIGIGYAADAPAYTASLDAAMMLVLEGCGWDVTFDGDATVYILPQRKDVADYREFHSEAATPVLALTAAALRAIAAKEVK